LNILCEGGIRVKVKAVIFDLDGTLITFKLDIVGMKKEIIRRLLKLNVARNLLNLNVKVAEMIEISKNYLLKMGRKDLAAKVISEVFSAADEFEVRAAKISELIEDAELVLKGVRELGLKVGLLTNNGRLATNIVLEKHGIAKYFDIIITRDETKTLKPDPTGLHLLLSALNVSPKEAIFVGDSIIDARAAKKAGVLFFGVETGIHDKDDLKRENAVSVFDNLKSFLQFLKKKMK